MKKEKSCGAIVYKFVDNELYLLLLHHNSGHWSFAKGHMEKNETERDTALREISEETGLSILIDTNFRYVSTYYPKENVLKDVVFFVGKYVAGNLNPQIEEICEIRWLNYKEVINLITYDADRKIAKEAIKYIMNKSI